jgi:hypothetical protein
MATQFDLASFFGGGGDSEIEKLLSSKQKSQLTMQATLAAAAQLLQAGGRSSQRIGLGQALGAAMQAGQGAYEKGTAGAVQNLLLGEKLREGQAERARDVDYFSMLKAGQPPMQPMPTAGGQMPMPPAAIDGSGVQMIAPDAAMPAAPMAAPAAAPNIFANLTPEQRTLLAGMPRKEGAKFLLETTKPEATPENIRTLRALGLPVTLEGLRQLDKPEADPENIRTLRALGLPVTVEGLRQLDRPEPSPSESRLLREAGVPVTLENIMQLRRSGASNVNVKVPVDMTGGQKGFENEMALGKSFKAEPIYKDFSDMQSAFSQVVSSLSAGTPIGDVAGATKIMKLLDPGSVVRESELAIAMAASGRMDRLNNYFSNMMSGQKLTPTQRDDFKALANELYAAAGDAYNKKRGEYEQFGNAYNFKNLSTALGAPATTPSIMRTRPGAGGGAARPSLSNIFGVPGG